MKRFSSEKGMTLVELLVAVGVLVSIAVAIGVRVGGLGHRARESSVRASLESIAIGLAMAREDTGRYPLELADLNSPVPPAYMQIPPRYWRGPYLQGVSLVDPWGNPYFYQPGGLAEVFGPFEFSAGSPPNHKYSGSFSFAALPGGGVVRIDNGPPTVSSGAVSVNGVQVVAPGDFPGKNREISKVTELKSSNTISVQITAPPNSVMVLRVASAASGGDSDDRYLLGSLGWGEGEIMHGGGR